VTPELDTIIEGDCVAWLKTLPDSCVDACVTDPPYELGFMGKKWDASGIANSVEMWREVLRVLKPGGHLLSFGGTRTYHRVACAIEDAGFEIRDMIDWLYGSGFPKSLNVSKAIDKAAGAVRISRGDKVYVGGHIQHTTPGVHSGFNAGGRQLITAPATPEAAQWDGWGTSLKPAHEPICVARKPLSEKTVAANVLKHGTGGVHVDAGRIKGTAGDNPTALRRTYGYTPNAEKARDSEGRGALRDRSDPIAKARPHPSDNLGRWPANVALDEEAAQALDEMSGECPTGVRRRISRKSNGVGNWGFKIGVGGGVGDTGGASRFFYVAKASKREREAGLDSIEIVMVEWMSEGGASWENEAQRVRLRVDMGQSPPRVIVASGIQESDACEWNTFLFGSARSGKSLLGIISTTATASRSITESKTLNWLRRSFTSGCTAAVNLGMASGGSPAESAGPSGPWLTFTNDATASVPGAEPVASGTRWRIRGNVASPADHPTVKPIALMRWLVRLYTPPGGIVLDPFAGSGTTCIAAVLEGFNYLACEQDAGYVAIAEARIAHWRKKAKLPLFARSGGE